MVAYGDELLQMARQRDDIVVLDADLLSDCGIEAFKAELPDRFIECGIAEQHMVSAAGGMALRGLLPVAHSFACFLSTRANEQIYNNATERRKDHLHGHARRPRAWQVRGIRTSRSGTFPTVGSIPGLTAIEPCSEREARLAIRWAVEDNPGSTYLRFVNVPLDLPYQLPASYALAIGRGVVLRPGADAVLVGYGPVLLSAAWRAADELAAQGIHVAVVNLPWLNRIDEAWVSAALRRRAADRDARQSLRIARSGGDGGRRARTDRDARAGVVARLDRRSRLWLECRSARAPRSRWAVDCASGGRRPRAASLLT